MQSYQTAHLHSSKKQSTGGLKAPGYSDVGPSGHAVRVDFNGVTAIVSAGLKAPDDSDVVPS